jgi:hypothetical protein
MRDLLLTTLLSLGGGLVALGAGFGVDSLLSRRGTPRLLLVLPAAAVLGAGGLGALWYLVGALN